MPTPATQPIEIANAPSRTGVRRFSVAHFLIAVIVLLCTVPFVDQLPNGPMIESLLITIVLLSAVMAVGGKRQTLLTAAVLVLPAVIGKWLQHFRPDLVPSLFTNVAAIVFVSYVVFHLFRFILRAPRVNNEVLYAALATYLMLGLLWAFIYLLVSRADPAAFTIVGDTGRPRPLVAHEAVFVSFGTLSNVGYADVGAVSRLARMLMIAEGMTGIFYIAIIVARLVAMYGEEERDEPQ